MGLVCGGLHAVGPDHLATLAAFSTLLEPWAAARVGAAWGLGHCAGVVAMAVLVFLAGKIPGFHLEGWERNGDYVIGFSMILVAVYFIFWEDRYIALNEEGQLIVKGCACCSQPAALEEAQNSSKFGPSEGSCSIKLRSDSSAAETAKLCGGYAGCKDEECAHEACDHASAQMATSALEAKESTPLLREGIDTQGRDVKSAAVGLVQGMCCPMGLIQLGYLAGRNAADTVVFVCVALLVSVVGTSLIAASWAALTRSHVTTRAVSPRLMYRGSCGMALMLGVLWIAANYMDILDKVNYAEADGMDGMHMH